MVCAKKVYDRVGIISCFFPDWLFVTVKSYLTQTCIIRRCRIPTDINRKHIFLWHFSNISNIENRHLILYGKYLFMGVSCPHTGSYRVYM